MDDVIAVGIAGVELDVAEQALRLRLQLSDGSIARCWWPCDVLLAVMEILGPEDRAPAGATVQ